jgi:hypothetical protein
MYVPALKVYCKALNEIVELRPKCKVYIVVELAPKAC